MSKRRVWIILFIAVLGLFIGFGAGGYLTANRVINAMEQIPASPIVLDTVYEKDENQLVMTLSNPGPVPLRLESYTVAFTPGSETEEAAYLISEIPIQLTLPPFDAITVFVDLKEHTADLALGDLVTISIFYTHPLAGDVYSIIHPYTQGPTAESTPPAPTPTPAQ